MWEEFWLRLDSVVQACAPAPSVAAAPLAAATQPQKEAETAGADAGLQVDFDDDEEEEEETAAQAAPQQQPARLPIAARLGSKVCLWLDSYPLRSCSAPLRKYWLCNAESAALGGFEHLTMAVTHCRTPRLLLHPPADLSAHK